MYDCFRPGDVVRAEVVSLGDARSYYLSTAKVRAQEAEAGDSCVLVQAVAKSSGMDKVDDLRQPQEQVDFPFRAGTFALGHCSSQTAQAKWLSGAFFLRFQNAVLLAE
eukprot:scaffold15976_cov17-Tisochrysis_lutea.AAC.4